MARQLSALGVDIIEAGFPIASEADAEAVRQVSAAVQGPVIAALARCHPADIDRAGEALAIRAAAPDSHVHRDVGSPSGAQAPHDARSLPRRGGRGGASGAQVHRRCAVLGGGCDAQRYRFSVPRRRGRHRRRLHDGQPAGHRRVRDPGRDRRVLRDHSQARAECAEGDVQHALSRRSRAGRREHDRRGQRRARARSSARSTASENARATRRSRRS